MKSLHIIPFFALIACAAAVSAAGNRPNIVFVLFDDMGWGQPQCYNPQSALRTPNLDKFATQGMRFADAHTAAAVCTPTRYGVLTGRYPSRIGQFGVLTTFSKPIIPEGRMTVASLLKQHGYATACIGKWHLGMDWVDGKPGSEKEVPIGARMNGGPTALGFDYFCGFTHARNIGTIIEQDRVIAHLQAEENQPLMLKKALEWIDQRKADEPFFLYFPLGIPHEPIVPAPEFTGKSGAQDLVRKDPKYGDWLFQGDAMLGKILDALERNKLADNTLVIATSDNGAEHRAYEPLRESKRSIYEGGHRVPFIARWPGKVKPGSLNDHTICLNDLMATAAEIIGAKIPGNAGEDSVSLIPELCGATTTGTREATIHQSAAGDLAIRQGPWKLIFLTSGQRELYNLQADLSETKDVLAANPEIVANMATRMQDCIAKGRSTAGAPQKNDFDLTITGGAAKGKRKKVGQKSEAERAREMALAADPTFD
ncbi:MAG TPA: arylsulfatase [Verrucomicrobiaceae bacterium]|jgi:arylsulfatase A-like enzyme